MVDQIILRTLRLVVQIAIERFILEKMEKT